MSGVTGFGPVELDLETIRSFVTVAAEGSLARAAPLLFVSTSGLSRRIHELEKELGVELLERSMHGVELTLAGEQVLAHAQRILEACDELFASAREAASVPAVRRMIHLGIAPGVESSVRDRVLCALRDADPEAGVAVDPDANTHLIRKLLVGELELAILHQRPISTEVESVKLGSRRTLICLAENLPQAQLATLSLSDLTTLPFITSSGLNAGTPVYYARLRSIFEEAGISRVIDVGAFDLYAIQQHVAGGSGFGIAFEGDNLHFGSVDVREVADLTLHLGTWLAWGRRYHGDAALQAAIAQLCVEFPAPDSVDDGDPDVLDRPETLALGGL